MQEKPKILVVVDPTTTEHPGMDCAIKLAAATDAVLELCICDHDPHLIGPAQVVTAAPDQVRRELELKHEQRLAALAAEVEKHAVDVTTDVRWDYPVSEGIIRKVLESAPGLVVKDTHYHGPIRRALFSSMDWDLIRHCPVPLLLAKPVALADEPVVVAAVDPVHRQSESSGLDERILSHAEKLIGALGGELHVFHSFPPPFYGGSGLAAPPGALTPDADVQAQVEAAHRAEVVKLLQARSVDNERIHVQAGLPADGLVKLAERLDASVVVMGAVSRSVFARAILGSTAERVLDRLPCHLLIVKPGDFVSPVEL